MEKHRKWLIATLLITVIAGGGLIYWAQNTPKPERVAVKQDNQAKQTGSESKKLVLSDAANFPSPVIQLQQTIVHGLLEAEDPDLPLLQGELKAFSQSNIDKEQPLPEQLVDLKQRLSALKAVMEPTE